MFILSIRIRARYHLNKIRSKGMQSEWSTICLRTSRYMMGVGVLSVLFIRVTLLTAWRWMRGFIPLFSHLQGNLTSREGTGDWLLTAKMVLPPGDCVSTTIPVICLFCKLIYALLLVYLLENKINSLNIIGYCWLCTEVGGCLNVDRGAILFRSRDQQTNLTNQCNNSSVRFGSS